MPITVDWYDEDALIILARFISPWELEELVESNHHINRLTRDCSKRFDIIADFSDTTFIPPVGVLWEWEKVSSQRDKLFPQWGLTIFVVEIKNELIEAYLKAGMQSSNIIRKHGVIVYSMKEAALTILSHRNKHSPQN